MMDTTFLRFIAILLISNSHLDKLYPSPFWSVGGQLGNSLFFMLSGFGITASYLAKGSLFLPWLNRRLSRIYPPVLLITLTAAAISGSLFQWDAVDFVRHLLWPTEYWFVAAIVFFYVPFYGLIRYRNKNLFLWVMGLLLVPYFYFYFTALDLNKFSIENGYFKWIFYFQVMLLGGYLASRSDPTKSMAPANWNVALLGLCVVAYFGIKLLVAKSILTELQVLIHWLSFPIVIFSLFAMSGRFIKDGIMHSVFAPFITLVAGATLEIYLLQRYVYSNPLVTNLSFPFNIAAFWPIVIAGAILMAWVSARISRVLVNWSIQPTTPVTARNEK